MPSNEPGIGDIGLVGVKGDVGWLISLGERLCGDKFVQYDHAFVYVGNGRIVEAEPGGAREWDLGEYDGRTIAWVRCPDRCRPAVAQQAQTFVGTGYGFADYLVIAAHRFHLPIPGLARRARSIKTMICSQLAVESARRGGWDLLGDEPAGYVTPADLGALAEPAA